MLALSPSVGKIGLRWSTDEELIDNEPYLTDRFKRDKAWPDGTTGWDRFHRQAIEEIERRCRYHKDTADDFEIGRVGLRSQRNLRPICAWFALHFMYVGGDTQGQGDNFFERRAAYWWDRATRGMESELMQLDYDFSNDGTISEDEQRRPFPCRMIRG